MDTSYYTNKHSCYLLQYHLALVTKYRHLNLLEVNTDDDHIHILFEAPPQIRLSDFVNAYKSASSRMIRKLFSDQLQDYYWKPYFWSLSYFIGSASEKSTAVIAEYIKNQ